MQVGIPGLQALKHQPLRRAPINPMDKSSVISIYPVAFKEVKLTLQPSVYSVPAGTYDNPGILVVGPASWWKMLDEEQPPLEIPQSSVLIAESIVNDYCRGMVACNMQDAQPGIFWLPGEITLVDLKSKYKDLLDTARAKQKQWYVNLVNMADALWARSNGNPLVIANDMRLAAKELGFDNREWLGAFTNVTVVRCVACGQMRDPSFPVCPNCKAVIDTAAAKKLNLAFAQ